MKKLLASILSCVLLLCCCFLGGCGKEEGTYRFVKMKTIDYVQDLEYTLGVGENGADTI